MAKVKRERTIDCVVMGWRPGKEEGTVGSLILGLYDGDDLRPVGHISGFTAKTKRSLRTMLAPLETGERGSGRAEPLDRRARPRVGRAAARAGDRGRLRPRRRRSDPPRRRASCASATTRTRASAASRTSTRVAEDSSAKKSASCFNAVFRARIRNGGSSAIALPAGPSAWLAQRRKLNSSSCSAIRPSRNRNVAWMSLTTGRPVAVKV